MADRILRDGLFSSDAWLALKNNDDRVCWLALFESADNLGNQPGGAFRMVRIWRPYGIDTPEKVAKVLFELTEVGLCRPYKVDGKPYLNLPRFNQSTRYPGHLYPLPPFANDEEKQVFAKKSRVIHSDSQRITEDHSDSHDGVGVGVGVGVGDKPKVKSSYVGINPDVTPLAEKKPSGKALHDAAKRVLECLNRNAGRRYEPVDANLKPILARFAEGYTEQDLRAISAVKARQWRGDEKMEPYIRPKTLFNATNAAQYRAELPTSRMEEE